VPQLQVRGLPRRRLHRDSDRSSRPA
jgi:hypothetical protein